MSEVISVREFGALQAEVAGLKEGVKELRSDVKSLIVAIENARGGWKTVAALGSISAAVGAGLFKLATFVAGTH